TFIVLAALFGAAFFSKNKLKSTSNIPKEHVKEWLEIAQITLNKAKELHEQNPNNLAHLESVIKIAETLYKHKIKIENLQLTKETQIPAVTLESELSEFYHSLKRKIEELKNIKPAEVKSKEVTYMIDNEDHIQRYPYPKLPKSSLPANTDEAPSAPLQVATEHPFQPI
ncbi:MAG TPA: hypothetical protein VJL60_03230, partial [Gammaproteobacteria bacterium]|nr:hypothetical protein [Gammaproteobacteria bacterium]